MLSDLAAMVTQVSLLLTLGNPQSANPLLTKVNHPEAEQKVTGQGTSSMAFAGNTRYFILS